ncbi:MAG TPA: hypothetical protein VFN25_02865 [Dokdonella sp.]|uniref:hypothetical protein n=1 Tax=Dokdonella sp. TaxID=2291710 RepID=UPI002D7E6E6F|nr:hypothetical protein [Dokdonella sp.]HET9031826.1 hypothetical protein [Dokdonella sp.]
MSEDAAKTAAEHLADTLAQLKEMRHYSKSNVENLTASWILFEGELKSLKQTGKFEDLMNRQSQFYDALEETIESLEKQHQEMTAVPEA